MVCPAVNSKEEEGVSVDAIASRESDGEKLGEN